MMCATARFSRAACNAHGGWTRNGVDMNEPVVASTLACIQAVAQEIVWQKILKPLLFHPSLQARNVSD